MSPDHPRTIDELCQLEREGRVFDFLFFWGHQPEAGGVSKGCLSQWWPSSFVIHEKSYPTSEHYMMEQKANLFRDFETATQILQVKDPAEAKSLGRQVRSFNETIWRQHRLGIVRRGTAAKFSQNVELATYLVSTSPMILVEASPLDKVWGIGMSAEDPRARKPSAWLGRNLLGFALMDVRHTLLHETKVESRAPRM
jgi:ribA/ribD-fused uncharacterized protein